MRNVNHYYHLALSIHFRMLQQTGDEFDFHDIFADYFEDFNADQVSNAIAAQQHVKQVVAQQQQQQQQQQQLTLPTGQGIQTAWHLGNLPAISGATNNGNSAGGIVEPAAKRTRHENLLLPGATMQQQSQQQKPQQLYNVPSGVGALSNRLGFTMPNTVQPQVQQQQQAMQQAMQQHPMISSNLSAGIKLPVGTGIHFGAMGNVVPNTSTGVVAAGTHQNSALIGQSYHHLTAGVNAAGTAAAANTSSSGGGILPNMQLRTNLGVTMPNAAVDKKSIEEQMSAERRQRNREHAKRSRVRKKFMLESLQTQVRGLQGENSTLRMLVQKHIPQNAMKIIDECCSKSVLFGTEGRGEAAAAAAPNAENAKEKGKEVALLKSDFSLIESLTSGQQNFVLSDPRLPDNPIVFASPGFYELTGYTRDEVLGRNCRFLQGEGTDPKSVDVIRTAIRSGSDATACLLNYKKDGTPFWNQLFVAALRDADDCIVNYVSTLIDLYHFTICVCQCI